jgi:hypothetical protein
MQLFSPGEEEELKAEILQLANWGWPCLISQLRGMASDLLTSRGFIRTLGLNWAQKFLSRHPNLKQRFVTGLDKERAFAENIPTMEEWFEITGSKIALRIGLRAYYLFRINILAIFSELSESIELPNLIPMCVDGAASEYSKYRLQAVISLL